MARDYKNSSSKKKSAGNMPPWLWLFAGLAIGLFVALLVYLDKRPDGRTDIAGIADAVTDKLDKSKSKDPAGSTSATAGNKPRFDFYNRLQQTEIMVPEQEIRDSRSAEQGNDQVSYFLQAGSFRSFNDADKLKADLALIGIESAIQRVTVNDAETWHRVRVGPFTNLRELSRVRNRMRENSIEPMMLKINS
jgi:cell division protein FtsN